MNFAKLFGCLVCFCSLAEKYDFVHHLNNFVILLITGLGYGISGIYILRSNNFRIKAICRIMRKAEIDSLNKCIYRHLLLEMSIMIYFC